MRQQIIIELEDSVVHWLTTYGEERGWTLEETIRYIVGNFGPPPAIMSLGGQIASPPISRPDDFMTKPLARMMALQGLAKCPNCLKKLTSDEIIEGKCSVCDAKL